MKEKLEQAVIKCLEDNGYYVRQVSISELPKVYETGEETLASVTANLNIKATKDSKFKTILGY